MIFVSLLRMRSTSSNLAGAPKQSRIQSHRRQYKFSLYNENLRKFTTMTAYRVSLSIIVQNFNIFSSQETIDFEKIKT